MPGSVGLEASSPAEVFQRLPLPAALVGDTAGMPPVEHCRTCQRILSQGRDHAHFPFCSSRCRDRDLGAWLNGSYAISQELDHQRPAGDVDSDQP
jgi:endogenous inhibitor of DNA gyrase (YacG/DUF329 family)